MIYLISFLLIGINIFQFLIVPLIGSWWFLTLIPIALLSNTLWSAIHEAIHDNLPRWIGVMLACVFGSSFHFLRAGHLTHHSLNRVDEQLEIVRPWESMFLAQIKYYFFLCGGLYLAEMMIPLAFIGPIKTSSTDKFVRMLFSRAEVSHVKIALESLACMGFLGLSLYLYGANWPILVGILVARAFFISSLDYIYHYGNPVGDIFASTNLRLPRWLSYLILRFNLHHSHHLSPSIPWNKLRGDYDDSYFRAARNVWKGPHL